jgi:hypothetical protein
MVSCEPGHRGCPTPFWLPNSTSGENRVDEMRRASLLLSVLIAVLIFTMRADSASKPDLAGLYLCSGRNFDGTPYDGLVEIVKDNGAFQLQWLAEGGVVALGMGIRSGNVLAVAYYSAVPGVVAYRIEGNNRLVGEWTLVGARGTLFTETLTKVPPDKVGPSRLPSRPAPPPPPDRRRLRPIKTL